MFHLPIQLRCPRSSHLLRVLLVGSLLLCGVLGDSAALGQSFTWDKIDPAFEETSTFVAARNLQMQVRMAQRPLANNRAAFEDWYRKYMFPAMASREHLEDLQKNRTTIEGDLEQCRDPAAQQLLRDLAYDEASKRVNGNYHPAVRLNAILLIGNLNQQERRRAERLPPIRLPRAFDFMLSEYKEADQHDAVRLGAILGMQRHLRLLRERPQDQPLTDAVRAEVSGLLETLVAQKSPPAGRPDYVHACMRRRAAETLGIMGQVGNGRSVFNTLIAIVEDTEESLPVRYAAARAIGDLDYTDVTGIDPIATTQKLAALAAAGCRQEDDWVKQKQKELDEKEAATRSPYSDYGGGYESGGGSSGVGRPSGTMGGSGASEGLGGPAGGSGDGSYSGSGYGDYGSEYGEGYGEGYESGPVTRDEDVPPTERELLMINARRRLKEPVFWVQLGIRGVERRSYGPGRTESTLGSVAQLVTDDDDKQKLEQILAALDALIEATDYIEEGTEEMMAQVRTKTRELEALLPGTTAEDAAPTAEDSLPGASLPGAATPGPAAPDDSLPGGAGPDDSLPGASPPGAKGAAGGGKAGKNG